MSRLNLGMIEAYSQLKGRQPDSRAKISCEGRLSASASTLTAAELCEQSSHPGLVERLWLIYQGVVETMATRVPVRSPQSDLCVQVTATQTAVFPRAAVTRRAMI